LNSPAAREAWYMKRHGGKFSYNKLEGQLKRRRAGYADALWSIDGTTVQLINNSLVHDLYIFYVFDAHSERVLAFDFAETENAHLVERTLRAALKDNMRKPYQMNYDGGSAILATTVKELMDRTSRVHFKSAPHRPRGKRAEQLTGRIEQHILRNFKNFKGSNITSPSIQGKANPDFVMAQKKKGELPSRDRVMLQMRLAIDIWNNTKGKRDDMTPNERYAVDHKYREVLEYDELFHLFMTKRKNQVSYKTTGIRIEINKEKHDYWVLDDDGVGDFEFRKNWLGYKFDIYVDVHDLGSIELYHNGKMTGYAVKKEEFAEAIVDREEGETERLRAYQDKQKRKRKERDEAWKENRAELEEMGIPELGFHDLHKDALNRFESEETLIELGLIEQKNKTTRYAQGADGRILE